MDKMPWQVILFQGIPEGIVTLYLGLVLVGVRPAVKKICLVGGATGLGVAVVRMFPIFFGFHTLCAFFIAFLLILFVFKVNWRTAFLAVLLGLLALAVVEVVFIPLVCEVMDISISEIMFDPWRRILVPLPHLFLLGVLAFFLARYDLCLIRTEELFKNEKQ